MEPVLVFLARAFSFAKEVSTTDVKLMINADFGYYEANLVAPVVV